jgi:glucose-1-phosphate thymidylyltransferase
MKGIILTGGKGTRLYPASKTINKGLLPVYDKPMIYYPLSTLMLSGIKDVLVIASGRDIERFRELLEDGSQIGINISYEVERETKGIGNAFIIGEEFIGNDDVCLVLGDNIFYGHKLPVMLKESVKEVRENNNSVVFGYYVQDPERFGVVEFDDNNNALSLEEKPENPKSNYAVVGLYYYTNDVVSIAKSLKPSDRGELEITDINIEYMNNKKLSVQLLGRGHAWLDTGTHQTLLEASSFIGMIESRQGWKISCIEEIAYRMGYISSADLEDLSKNYNNEYGEYLLKVSKLRV